MKVFAGSSNRPLAQKLAKALNLKISPLEIHIFPDGERRVRVLEDVVDQDTVVVQSCAPPVEVNYMELFFIVDALKRSGAKTVTAVIPYLGYQRQDHVFRSGEAVSLSVIVKTLESVGVDRVIVFDLHSVKTPELFSVAVSHLLALPLFAQKIRELLGAGLLPHAAGAARQPQSESGGLSPSSLSERRPPKGNTHSNDKSGSAFSSPAGGQSPIAMNDVVVISPDMGGIRRIKLLAKMLGGTPYATIVKNRDLQTGRVTAERIEGTIRKRAIIVDDMISSGGTVVTAAKLLKEKRAEEVLVFATHPVFSGNAPEALQNCLAKRVFVTDTIFVPKEKIFPKLEILSVVELIAKELRKSKS